MNNMKNDLISVIIPIYNSEKTIASTLDSILKQKYKNIEIICVNDGSKDNSLQILNNYKEIDSRVKIIDKQNSGVSDTRNIGINHAKGRFLTFADADDYINENMYEIMLNRLIQDKSQIAMCSFKQINVNSEEEMPLPWSDGTVLNKKNIIDELIPNLMLSKCRGVTWNLLIDTLNAPKTFMPKEIDFQEDLIFCIDLFLKSKSISVVNISLYNYVRHENSVMEKYRKNCFEERLVVRDTIKNLLNEHHLFENPTILQAFYLYCSTSYARCINNEYKKGAPSIKNRIKNLKDLRTKLLNDNECYLIFKYLNQQDMKKKVFLSLLKFNCIYLIEFIYSIKLLLKGVV